MINLKNVKPILLGCLMFSSFVFSQTKQQVEEIRKTYNLSKLKTIENTTKEQKSNAKKEALDMAQIKGWPVTYTENGSFYELMSITKDNQPIYYKTHNQNAAISTRANYLNTGGGLGLELEGQGMKAYVWDGGWVHTTHQEFDGAGGEDRVSIGDDENQYSDHGTHVTGTIVASGVNPEAKGMAPQATAVSYRWNSDVPEVAAAAADGMLLSNHSYGYGASGIPDSWFGAYLDDARDFDEIMYNAPYYLMVVSCGNDGSDGSSNADPIDGNSQFDKLSGMSTTKNNISVANGRDAEIDAEGNLISMIRNNGSSEGPTDDFRIKPDIIGNGTGLISPVGDSNNYGNYTGTSMSGPNVMGSLLLLQQHYNNVNGAFMKASTLKGLALHTADDITTDNSNGATQALVGPDATTGWGLMNTKKAAEAINNNGFNSLIMEEVLNEGDTYTISVRSDDLNPLLASISWTDVPGELSIGANDPTPALVNDLDIRVTQGDDSFEPWKLTSINTNDKGDNIVDPYERVDVENASGDYTITVTHKGTLADGPVNFSLVVTGMTSDFNITSINSPKTQCSDSDAVFNLNYVQTIETTTNLSFENLPSGATANFSPETMSSDGEFTFTVSGLENVAAGTYDINIVGDNGSSTQTRKVELRVVKPDFTDNPMTLSYPANSEAGILVPNVTLAWEENINAQSYTVEVSKNPSFIDVISSSTQTELEHLVTGLESNTVYYWRVNPSNECGSVNSTNIFSFQTASAEDCTNSFTATDFDNDRISAGSSGSASLPIEIDQDLTISRLIVDLDIEHLDVGELEVYLQEPDELGSNQTYLLQNVCAGAPNITGAIFSDTGSALECGTEDPAISGTILPAQSLASSSGKSSLGTWSIHAIDETFQNGGEFTAGYMTGATITVCTASANTSLPNFENNLISVAANGTTSISSADIQATSTSETASQQMYTIIALPTKGDITKSGTVLVVGDTFTQEDVDLGNIAYTNNQTSLFTDSFKVDITNSLNGWLANQVINIEATTLSTISYDLSKMLIYPNPSSQEINIQFETSSNELVTITLFDLQGRKVFRSEDSSEQRVYQKTINVRMLANGIYILKATQGNQSTSLRLIISK